MSSLSVYYYVIVNGVYFTVTVPFIHLLTDGVSAAEHANLPPALGVLPIGGNRAAVRPTAAPRLPDNVFQVFFYHLFQVQIRHKVTQKRHKVRHAAALPQCRGRS